MRTRQRSIQNLHGYVLQSRAPKSSNMMSLNGLRGLGRMTREPEGGYVTDPVTGAVIGINPGNPQRREVAAPGTSVQNIFTVPPPAPAVQADNYVTQPVDPRPVRTSRTTDPFPSNYVAAPPAVAAVASTTAGFSLSDVPWWGWAAAAFVGYSLLSGSSAPARRYR